MPAAAAARSASPMVEATQVASDPTTRGRMDPARPPAEVAGHRDAVLEVEGQGTPVGHEDGVGQRAVAPAGDAVLSHGGTLPVGGPKQAMRATP